MYLLTCISVYKIIKHTHTYTHTRHSHLIFVLSLSLSLSLSFYIYIYIYIYPPNTPIYVHRYTRKYIPWVWVYAYFQMVVHQSLYHRLIDQHYVMFVYFQSSSHVSARLWWIHSASLGPKTILWLSLNWWNTSRKHQLQMNFSNQLQNKKK